MIEGIFILRWNILNAWPYDQRDILVDFLDDLPAISISILRLRNKQSWPDAIDQKKTGGISTHHQKKKVHHAKRRQQPR